MTRHSRLYSVATPLVVLSRKRDATAERAATALLKLARVSSSCRAATEERAAKALLHVPRDRTGGALWQLANVECKLKASFSLRPHTLAASGLIH